MSEEADQQQVKEQKSVFSYDEAVEILRPMFSQEVEMFEGRERNIYWSSQSRSFERNLLWGYLGLLEKYLGPGISVADAAAYRVILDRLTEEGSRLAERSTSPVLTKSYLKVVRKDLDRIGRADCSELAGQSRILAIAKRHAYNLADLGLFLGGRNNLERIEAEIDLVPSFFALVSKARKQSGENPGKLG